MQTKSRPIAIISAAGMLMLILDSKTALHGAAEGIDLCIRVLIPSLFPFFVLSVLLTGALSGQAVRCLQPIGAACRMPKGSESLIAVSMLGGYPVGAQSISLLFHQGQIHASQAMRLLPFCNNAGPAFIFGVLGLFFSGKYIPWLLWAVHILSSVLTGMLLPDAEYQDQIRPPARLISFTEALSQAVKIQALVCGWVIFMRIILAFLESWILQFLPAPFQIILTGFLELSNGCIRLAELEREGLRFIIASALLSLGGLCVTLQTASAVNGISMRLYFPGKALQCCFSILLSCLLQSVFPATSRCSYPTIIVTAVITIPLAILFMQYSKKVVEFPKPLVYNRINMTKEVSSCCFVKK